MTLKYMLDTNIVNYVIERRPPFARVRLANGSDAWVSEASLTSIHPGNASGDVTGLP